MAGPHFQAHGKGETPPSFFSSWGRLRWGFSIEVCMYICVRVDWQTYWYNPDTKETTWFHPVTNQPSVRMLALLNLVSYLLCPHTKLLERQRTRSCCHEPLVWLMLVVCRVVMAGRRLHREALVARLVLACRRRGTTPAHLCRRALVGVCVCVSVSGVYYTYIYIYMYYIHVYIHTLYESEAGALRV